MSDQLRISSFVFLTLVIFRFSKMDFGGSDGIGDLQNQLGEMASSFVSPDRDVQGVSRRRTQFQNGVSKKSGLSF